MQKQRMLAFEIGGSRDPHHCGVSSEGQAHRRCIFAPGLGVVGAHSRRNIICREIVAAVDAEEIGYAYAAIALSTTRRDLAGALRAEVVVRLDTRAACRTAGDH